MCGLAGAFSNYLSDNEKEDFRLLLMLNVMRGKDSTGVFGIRRSVNKNVERPIVHSFRASLPSPVVLYEHSDKEVVKNVLEAPETKILAGHTRWATIGAVTKKNAHPFNFHNLIGMINGTVRKDFKHSKEFETDSEAILKNISEYGIEAALKEIQASTSSYAIVWYDKNEQTLNFVRNQDRPLFFKYTKGRQTLYWASEKSMLEFLHQRRNLQTDEKSPDNLFFLKPNQLMTIKVAKYGGPDQMRLKELNIPIVSYYNARNHNTGPWDSGSWGYWRNGVWVAREEEKRHSPFLDQDDEESWKTLYGDIDPIDPNDDLPPVKTPNERVIDQVLHEIDKAQTGTETRIPPEVLSAKDTQEEETKGQLSKKELRKLQRRMRAFESPTYMFHVYKDHFLKKADYEKLLNEGCAHCSKQPNVIDEVRFLDKETFLCQECTSKDWVKEMFNLEKQPSKH